jgi:hypothetical protein
MKMKKGYVLDEGVFTIDILVVGSKRFGNQGVSI